jgi:VWFA-related protein
MLALSLTFAGVDAMPSLLARAPDQQQVSQPSTRSSAQSSIQSPAQPSPQTPQAPAVHATTRLVWLSVVVKDKNGSPVSDLTSADFSIRDEKKPQAIRFFRVDSNEPPKAAPKPLPADIYTNRPQDAASVPPNVTVILFDGLNTKLSDQAQARDQVSQFLKQIQPNDRVALYALGRELHVLQDFTRDSSRLVAALRKSRGETTMDLDASTPDQVQTGNDAMDLLLKDAFQREASYYIQERVHLTVAALTEISQHLASLPGRKNLVWVSGSFPFSVGYENIEDLQLKLDDPTDEQRMFAEDIEKAARALNDADIAVYPVDARGLLGFDINPPQPYTNLAGSPAMNANSPGASSGPGGGRRGLPGTSSGNGGSTTGKRGPANLLKSPDTTNLDTMNTLASRTGGKAFYNTNDIMGALRKAIDDSRLTYEIGYYPEDVKWNGAFHNVELKVARPGVEVRARKGYFALPQPKLTPDSRQAAIQMALASPIDATQVGFVTQVRAADVPGARTLFVAVKVAPNDIDFELADGKYSGAMEYVLAQMDDSSKVLDGTGETFHLHYLPEQYDRARAAWLTFSKTVPYHADATHLRLIVRDPTTGKIGAVDIPLASYFPVQSPAVN